MKNYKYNVLLLICLVTATIFLSCSNHNASNPSENLTLPERRNLSGNKEFAEKILNNPDLPLVLEKAKSILKKGLTAGSGYGEVWIRDLNTFIELALEVQDKAELRRSLLVFFHFQGKDGNIIDGYIPKEQANVAYKYIRSDTMPNLLGHKNTVETDQESSLVQAIFVAQQASSARPFKCFRNGLSSSKKCFNE